MSSRLPAARRKEQLLDVAMRAFAERGFHATSMNDVADAAGVTKPVLYQHFPSKRALYLELLRSVGDELMQAIADATAGAGPREQVEQGLRAYFRFVADEGPAYWLMFGGGTRRDAEFAEEATRVERSIAAVIAELIAVEGLSEDDRLLYAHGIVGLAEGTSRHLIGEAQELDPDAVAVKVADLAWRGLRGLRSEPA